MQADDVFEALLALGRAEAFKWLAETLGEGGLLGPVVEALDAMAASERDLAASVGEMLKKEAENA